MTAGANLHHYPRGKVLFKINMLALPEDIMRFVRVASRCWACIGGEDVLHSCGANQGFVEGENASLAVDSGFHYRTAGQVLMKIGEPLARRILLVDTHYHSDRVFGNGMFVEKCATVVSHRNCRQRMKAQSWSLLSRYRSSDPRASRLLEKVKVSLPSVTYQDRLWAHLDDDVTLEIVHPVGIAPTDSDLIVHLPDDKVVFASDFLWMGYHPNLEDADINSQIMALKTILQWNPRRIVPGHGPVCGLPQLRQFII